VLEIAGEERVDLFRHQAARAQRGQPLAERMRPAALEAFVGQRHLLAPGKMLERAIAQDRVPSLILWGPPGSGKTTLARIVARRTGARFAALSAVGSGVKELREAVAAAALERDHYSRRTILFIDEIHRFNKAQQDALLPHVEAGTVTLIGATTENPSFEVVAPLLSRCRVVRLEALGIEELTAILARALAEDAELKRAGSAADGELLEIIARAADGDARRALTSLEVAAGLAAGGALTREVVEQALQRRTLLYDKGGEEHYNVVSAFIKSMRGSDPHAAVYWMVRMLEAGEDPLFVVRRMVIFAAEDIGNADPQALGLATAAMEAVRFVGLPEAVLPMTQAATYLATAPKSNAALTAYSRARRDVLERGPLAVPARLRNAPTKLMRDLGYGSGYRYPHDFAGNYVPERYLPDELAGACYYTPGTRGHEVEIAARVREREETLESAQEVDHEDDGEGVED
jgi:putative ATPase